MGREEARIQEQENKKEGEQAGGQKGSEAKLLMREIPIRFVCRFRH
jgi:hypothetical protein